MNSRIPDFYADDRPERLATVADRCDLDDAVDALDADDEVAGTVDGLSENVVGSVSYPLSVATNFVVDGEDVLVPMAVEESSVVAAASKGALLARPTGGFTTDTDGPYMIGQIQVADVADPIAARQRVLERADDVVTVPLDVEWDDLGSWDAFQRLLPADEDGTVVAGDAEVVSLDATDNVVASDGVHVSLVGVEGLAVVAYDDRVLVVPTEDTQRVRDLVATLKERGEF